MIELDTQIKHQMKKSNYFNIFFEIFNYEKSIILKVINLITIKKKKKTYSDK